MDASPSSPRSWRTPLAGALAAAAALGVAELAAAQITGASSLVVAVGAAVIDFSPPWVKDAAIAVLGTADKPALVIGVVALSLAFGAGLGHLAARRLWAGVALIAAFGVLGAAAAARAPQGSLAAASAVATAAVAAGSIALALLVRAAASSQRPSAPAGAAQTADAGRRAFLRLAVGVAAVAVVSVAAGRMAVERRAAATTRASVGLPPPAQPVSAPPDAASLDVEGLTPLITPNADFYRIDTALATPRVDAADWRLEVVGMVDKPFSLTYDELLALPHVESYVTIACVSNEVGGRLIGNARWTGVPLHRLLERAGVQDGADQIIGRSTDGFGFTAGFPTEAAFDGREALVAVGMNGEPLPPEHGFPARLVVAGLYGYVSATKWLREIELTTWEGADGYWIPRGWAKEAPIKTQSRIDVPRNRADLAAGRQAIAGVAWAPNIGVDKVEVQIDDGPWAEARTAQSLTKDTWRQWVYDWDASPGRHTIRVRATDATGATQTAERRPPAPDGATGHHTITVSVA